MSYDLPSDITEAVFYGRMAEARAQLEALVSGLPSGALDAPRDAAGWSTLDHLAHVGVWEQSVADVLNGLPRQHSMGVSRELLAGDDFDAINAAIRAWTSQLRTDEQMALFVDGHANLLAAMSRVGWDALQQPYATFDPLAEAEPAGTSMLAVAWADGPIHFEVHAQWIRALHDPAPDAP